MTFDHSAARDSGTAKAQSAAAMIRIPNIQAFHALDVSYGVIQYGAENSQTPRMTLLQSCQRFQIIEIPYPRKSAKSIGRPYEDFGKRCADNALSGLRAYLHKLFFRPEQVWAMLGAWESAAVIEKRFPTEKLPSAWMGRLLDLTCARHAARAGGPFE